MRRNEEGLDVIAGVDDAGRRARTETILWIAASLVLITVHTVLRDASSRLHVLRAVLILAAAGEALGGVSGIFGPRRFAERNGRPYDPAYHGVSQDFGFYNTALAVLLALAALRPETSHRVIATAAGLYAVHGLTHACRHFGLYYGGGAPIPTRPQMFELRDGAQLLAAAAGMVLFFP